MEPRYFPSPADLRAGLAAFEARSDDRSALYSYEQRHAAKLDPDQERRLRADPAAWEWFQSRRRHGDEPRSTG